jgi:tagatose 1,6-diphosphate aldolase
LIAHGGACYGGNIGYGLEPAWRGRHYAGKACKLLKQVALDQGMGVLWITCNPDNWPSRRTCEWIGATLVEIVDLPPDNDQYLDRETRKCRCRSPEYGRGRRWTSLGALAGPQKSRQRRLP